MKPTHRLYVDEVGNDDMRPREGLHERYLSLTGVAISLDDVRHVLHPAMREMRDLFGSDPDEQVVLHRRELAQRKYPFHRLKDADVNREFNAQLLTLLADLDYTAFTVVIDKWEHNQRYAVWRFHPYHYCMHVLLERYVQWLAKRGAVGDVMAEARNKTKDKKLKATFSEAYTSGTGYVKADEIQRRLTSSQIKLKGKGAAVDGLELTDLLAYPAFRWARRHRLSEQPTGDFWEQIAAILESRKFHRRWDGQIAGWGCKWLP